MANNRLFIASRRTRECYIVAGSTAEDGFHLGPLEIAQLSDVVSRVPPPYIMFTEDSPALCHEFMPATYLAP